MRAAELAFFNRTSDGDGSGLRNPLIKLLLLLSPLAFVTYQQVGRQATWPRLELAEVAIVALVLYWGNILNFADIARPSTSRRCLWSAVFFGGIYFVAKHPDSEIAKALGVLSRVLSSIPIVRDIAGESWLYLVFFYIAVVAVRNFDTREAMWLGRRLLWRHAFLVYAVVIVTLAVINSALPLRMSVAWEVTRSKVALLKNPHLRAHSTFLSRISARATMFATMTIGNTSAVAHTVELLMEQRGFFRQRYNDVIGYQVGNEDYAALLLLALAIFVLATRLVA